MYAIKIVCKLFSVVDTINTVVRECNIANLYLLLESEKYHLYIEGFIA